MFPRWFILCIVCLLCSRAFADSSPRWFEVKTDHFTVVTDTNEKQARRVAGQLERMHALFAKLLPHATTDPGSEIVVLAVKNRKEMQTIEPSAYLTKNALDLAGLFLQKQDRSYILLRLDASEEDHPYATVYHEYTHYMVRHLTILPIWLNEGMAQFFQNAEILDKDARFGEANRNQILFLQQERLIPLPLLFTIDHSSPYYHEEDKGSVFYAESWALTHYLRVQDFQNKTTRLQSYVTYLTQGEDPVKAGEHAFGDLNKLQQTLEYYIRQGSFSMFLMPLESNIDDAAFAVQPLPTPDADALRADVLAEEGRKEDARALLASVLEQAPENAQAHESMGLLELRDGNQREARRWYSEAVALHSSSYLAFYYFSSLSIQLGDADQSTGESLRQALKLNPRFAPAADALAQFDGMHDQMDEAKSMIARAVELEPGNVNYRLNAAALRERSRDFASAESILKAAEKVAATQEDKDRVLQQLKRVQRYQQQVAEASAEREKETAQMAANGAQAPPNATRVTDMRGHTLHPVISAAGEHSYPAGPAAGPRHTVKGVMHNVGCFYPKGLTLDVDGIAKSVSLYSNDMYAVQYSASNFTPKNELNPCEEFEGMKASVVYAEVDDRAVAGQIVSIELSK